MEDRLLYIETDVLTVINICQIIKTKGIFDHIATFRVALICKDVKTKKKINRSLPKSPSARYVLFF